MAEISKRKRIWGWWFFDWASQPYHTLLVTFVFGPYFAGVAAEYFMAGGQVEEAADARAQSLWSLCLTITGLIMATALVCGSASNAVRQSTKSVPISGSPPIPTHVDWPMPFRVNWKMTS